MSYYLLLVFYVSRAYSNERILDHTEQAGRFSLFQEEEDIGIDIVRGSTFDSKQGMVVLFNYFCSVF